ncbi:MAG: porphobilinogen synthase [Anaerolineae bacterium]|nr:porphobilinogen synthase [Anaerolineae bacterium]MDW8070464.1 porphobilinogen synthase [Anaerolineae bacterium]
MPFPITRLRRLRATPTLREMVRETQLDPRDLIYPLFAVHGEAVRRPVSSMPGVYQLSVDQLVREAQECHALGIPAVILFGVPAHKDAQGSENFSDDGIVQRAVRALKAALPQLIVIADLCMCEYTDHGHCGIVRDGQIDNDATLEILGRAAVSYARAGADIVAPSGMMDGMVASIRSALDEAGFANVSILSYAIKYASAFYGPFREAAEGAPKFGDRKTHQMDPANAREALRELELDIQEGADMVMVKPALSYLDIVHRVRQATHLPVAAYNVSGEYAMVKAAAANGWLDERAIVLEVLTSIKRAGADLILTYHAKDAARWLAGM